MNLDELANSHQEPTNVSSGRCVAETPAPEILESAAYLEASSTPASGVEMSHCHY